MIPDSEPRLFTRPVADALGEVGRRPVGVGGLWGASKSLLAAEAARASASPLVVVAPSNMDADHIAEDLAVFLPEYDTLMYPAWGVLPEDVAALSREIAGLSSVRLTGLMTMGPLGINPEDSRPYFRLTRQVFEEMKELNLPGVEMRHLSMGMTDSYKVAIEEGANIIRIGTAIFGPRD